MILTEERRIWRPIELLLGRSARWHTEELRGVVARGMKASRCGARGGGATCATRGGGELAREGSSGGGRARRISKQRRRRRGALWREYEAPVREGVGPGGTREAWRHANKWRGQSVDRKTGGVAVPPGLRGGWRWKM